MELAGELLEVNSEAELDQFLGSVIKRAARGIGKIARSPIGRMVGGYLKGMAKKALPMAGAALGGYIGGPIGAKLGHAVASYGAKHLEMEMLEAEDMEFEGAKQFVRICGDATRKALSAPANVNPQVAAQQAVTAAVAKHTPGLMTGKKAATTKHSRAGRSAAHSKFGQSGRWMRKGNNIVLLNA